MNCQILWALVFVLMFQANCEVVRITLLKDPTAVCIDGSRAGYFHSAGSGEGADSWLVYLEGGAWCGTPIESCEQRKLGRLGSNVNETTEIFSLFGGILSFNQTINPDFFNWNKVYVRYCDDSSFIGDTEIASSESNLQLRGSRIFNAVMDDLLGKGIGNANNAILAGFSAGGLATILQCDAFKAFLPWVDRVKCISDSGFFIRAKNVPDADYRESFFEGIINTHNLTSFLPVSCTSRINSSLCLFPEYLVGDISTPLFLLNTAFDSYQIQNLLKAPYNQSWENCTKTYVNADNCTSIQIKLIKDFRIAFLKALKEIGDNPSRGMFINSCYDHVISLSNEKWNSIGSPRLENKTISEAIGEWYFDRSSIQLIDDRTEFALQCT